MKCEECGAYTRRAKKCSRCNQKAYNKTDKCKAYQKAYRQRPEMKAYMKAYHQTQTQKKSKELERKYEKIFEPIERKIMKGRKYIVRE